MSTLTPDQRDRLRLLVLRAIHAYELKLGEDEEFAGDDDVFLDGIIDEWRAKYYAPSN